MFTGLVEGMGTIRKLITEGAGLRMTIDLGPLAEGVSIGDSIANSGCCLTVVSIKESECDFELGSETLSKTLSDPGTSATLSTSNDRYEQEIALEATSFPATWMVWES